MRVALFVPCYVDQLYPDVGLASLELLESLGFDVWLPDVVSCCGQPLINTGAVAAARPLALGMQRIAQESDALVCPSGSCVATLHQHAPRFGLNASALGQRVFELSEFLEQHLAPGMLSVSFPHRVALHQSCHGLRELGHGSMSELAERAPVRHSPAHRLLSRVAGLTMVKAERPDECCGFGGSFCIGEAEVSSQMGRDRVAEYARAGAEVITSVDMSCLMHLSGISRREQRSLQVMHIAQILAGRSLPD